MESTQMKPYGVLRAQGQKYFLLNPQPVPKDSCWNDGVYTFFVATWNGVHIPTHVIIQGSFSIELDSRMPSIDVLDIHVGEEEADWYSVTEAGPLVFMNEGFESGDLMSWEELLDHETAVLDDQEPLTDDCIDTEEGE